MEDVIEENRNHVIGELTVSLLPRVQLWLYAAYCAMFDMTSLAERSRCINTSGHSMAFRSILQTQPAHTTDLDSTLYVACARHSFA